MKKLLILLGLVLSLNASDGSSSGFGLMSLIVLYLLVTGKLKA